MCHRLIVNRPRPRRGLVPGETISVRKDERSESKLKVQDKAEELLAHTVHIVSNPNVFDPKYAMLHERIVDCAVEIGVCLWEANGIRVDRDAGKYRMRRDLQDRAIRKTASLLYLMTAAKRLDHLRSRKYWHWVGMAETVKDMAKKWRDSDAHRYGHLIRDTG